MLDANTLRLETEGVAVRDSEFNCGLRFLVGLNVAYEIVAQSGIEPSVTNGCGAVSCPRNCFSKRRLLECCKFRIAVKRSGGIG